MFTVFQIALPSSYSERGSERGSYLGDEAISKWVARALEAAGGYTFLGSRLGAWRDDSDGVVHTEHMYWYEVACPRATWDLLVVYAFQLFPRERAIYTAKVGVAEIIEAPAVVGGE